MRTIRYVSSILKIKFTREPSQLLLTHFRSFLIDLYKNKV